MLLKVLQRNSILIVRNFNTILKTQTKKENLNEIQPIVSTTKGTKPS